MALGLKLTVQVLRVFEWTQKEGNREYNKDKKRKVEEKWSM